MLAGTPNACRKAVTAPGLVAVTAFLHAFVFRRRGYVWLFAASLVLMLYTDAAGLWFFGATAVALIPADLRSDDRAGVLRDGLIAFAAAAILYLRGCRR